MTDLMHHQVPDLLFDEGWMTIKGNDARAGIKNPITFSRKFKNRPVIKIEFHLIVPDKEGNVSLEWEVQDLTESSCNLYLKVQPGMGSVTLRWRAHGLV